MLKHFLLHPVHASWMIAITSVGVVAGVACAKWNMPVQLGQLGWLAAGIALVLTAIWRTQFWMVLLAIGGGLLIGAWRGTVVQSELTGYRPLMRSPIMLTGKVLDDVEKDVRGRYVVRLGDIRSERRQLPGSIWVAADRGGPLKRSDYVTVAGRLEPGFGSFAGAMYDAEVIGIKRQQSGDMALTLRDRFAQGVTMGIKEPEASLGLGYLAGMRRGLPEELDEALLVAGLTHIVVASGYNLTILIRIARRSLERISKYLALLSSSGLIIGFIAVTGMSPSMARAGLVAGLSLLAWYYGRRFHPLVLLPFAMAITLMVQPSFAWGDIGWQLSFAAFGGVMLLAPLVSSYFFADQTEHPLRRIFIETLSAQIATLPILLTTFGVFSLIAPLANMLILPFVPLAMLLTFVAGLSGLLVAELADLISFPAQLLLTYMTQTIQYVGNLDWAQQELELNFIGVVGYYCVLALLAAWMWRSTRLNLQQTSLIE